MDSEQYETAKTAVFWDVEDCPIPDGLNVVAVSDNIRSALEKINYRGTSTIYAYGDRNLIQQGLESNGIMINYTPAGDRYARLGKIILDCFGWAIDNPAPANVMFIMGDLSGQGEYISVFHNLCHKRYNVLFAQPRNASGPVSHPVSTKWLWESLSFGEDPLDNQTEPSLDDQSKHSQPLDNTSVGNKMSPFEFLLAGVGAVWIVITWTKLSQLSLRFC